LPSPARRAIETFDPPSKPAFLLPEAIARARSIPAGAKILYSRMLRFQHKGGICYASVAYLAKSLNVAARTVDRWLAALVGAGFIRRVYISGFRTKVTAFEHHEVFWPVENSPEPVEETVESFPRGTPGVSCQERQDCRAPVFSEQLEREGESSSLTATASVLGEPAVENRPGEQLGLFDGLAAAETPPPAAKQTPSDTAKPARPAIDRPPGPSLPQERPSDRSQRARLLHFPRPFKPEIVPNQDGPADQTSNLLKDKGLPHVPEPADFSPQ
jgi:hypothetical protein